MDNHIFEQQIYEKEYQEEFVDEYEEESQQNYQNAWLLMSFSQSAQENAERMHGHYQQMSEADTVTMEDEDTSAGVEALIMLSAQPTTQSTAPSAVSSDRHSWGTLMMFTTIFRGKSSTKFVIKTTMNKISTNNVFC